MVQLNEPKIQHPKCDHIALTEYSSFKKYGMRGNIRTKSMISYS